jgi:hypothetical protein
MDGRHENPTREAREPRERERIAALPLVTNAERAFWRRAVEIERARQRCGRPSPFPFQPA